LVTSAKLVALTLIILPPVFLKVIAAAVASDPEKYNEVFLGKPNEAYCAWILDSEKWGGEFQHH
jgi:ubiquitin thioesterase OTU1